MEFRFVARESRTRTPKVLSYVSLSVDSDHPYDPTQIETGKDTGGRGTGRGECLGTRVRNFDSRRATHARHANIHVLLTGRNEFDAVA